MLGGVEVSSDPPPYPSHKHRIEPLLGPIDVRPPAEADHTSLDDQHG